jgi:hypothetical protein
MIERRLTTFSFLKMVTTDMGSVAEIREPKRRTTGQVRPMPK